MSNGGFVRVSAGEEAWQDAFGHGLQTTVLYGDPAKEGIYVLRTKWPPYVMSRPHHHPEDRHVVVVSGTWYAGTSDVFDPSTAVPMKAGGYMLHPAGAVHWDGSKDEETVVHLVGYGPSETIFVDSEGPELTEIEP